MKNIYFILQCLVLMAKASSFAQEKSGIDFDRIAPNLINHDREIMMPFIQKVLVPVLGARAQRVTIENIYMSPDSFQIVVHDPINNSVVSNYAVIMTDRYNSDASMGMPHIKPAHTSDIFGSIVVEKPIPDNKITFYQGLFRSLFRADPILNHAVLSAPQSAVSTAIKKILNENLQSSERQAPLSIAVQLPQRLKGLQAIAQALQTFTVQMGRTIRVVVVANSNNMPETDKNAFSSRLHFLNNDQQLVFVNEILFRKKNLDFLASPLRTIWIFDEGNKVFSELAGRTDRLSDIVIYSADQLDPAIIKDVNGRVIAPLLQSEEVNLLSSAQRLSSLYDISYVRAITSGFLAPILSLDKIQKIEGTEQSIEKILRHLDTSADVFNALANDIFQRIVRQLDSNGRDRGLIIVPSQDQARALIRVFRSSLDPMPNLFIQSYGETREEHRTIEAWFEDMRFFNAKFLVLTAEQAMSIKLDEINSLLFVSSGQPVNMKVLSVGLGVAPMKAGLRVVVYGGPNAVATNPLVSAKIEPLISVVSSSIEFSNVDRSESEFRLAALEKEQITWDSSASTAVQRKIRPPTYDDYVALSAFGKELNPADVDTQLKGIFLGPSVRDRQAFYALHTLLAIAKDLDLLSRKESSKLRAGLFWYFDSASGLDRLIEKDLNIFLFKLTDFEPPLQPKKIPIQFLEKFLGQEIINSAVTAPEDATIEKQSDLLAFFQLLKTNLTLSESHLSGLRKVLNLQDRFVGWLDPQISHDFIQKFIYAFVLAARKLNQKNSVSIELQMETENKLKTTLDNFFIEIKQPHCESIVSPSIHLHHAS